MNKTLTTVVLGLGLCTYVCAQEVSKIDSLGQEVEKQGEAISLLSRLKVSGYVQMQSQYGQESASLKVGVGNEARGASFHRLGVRRGRIKFVYSYGIASTTLQFDMTERGVGIKDVFLSIKAPKFETNSLKVGVFDRPFGHEIGYSSSTRETPERSTIFQTLFPDERDLGAMLVLQPSKTSPWNVLKLEAGLFSGNGIKQETDSRRDFIGRLSFNKTMASSAKLGLGASLYHGYVWQGSEEVYHMDGSSFVLDNSVNNKGAYARRQYFGFDGQFSVISALGMTHLRAEYIIGTQPGTLSSSKSPNATTRPTEATYIRPISGGYAMLVQDIGELPISAIVKYDWYDPNTKVSGTQIGLNNTGRTDLTYSTLGLGLLWRISSNLRMQAYYEMVSNETSVNLKGYEKDVKDDMLTLRLQYKF